MDDDGQVNELYARLIRFGQASRRRYLSGGSEIVDDYLGGLPLSRFVEIRMGDLDGLERERAGYSPPLWRLAVDEICEELDGVYYCSHPRDRFTVREVWQRARDMTTWYLRPIWGVQSVSALRQLELEHRTYFGDRPPIVIADEWKRKVRRIASPIIFVTDDFRCVRCGSTRKLSVDHIVPIMRGGLNYGLNFQTLCMPCNNWKSARVWWPGSPEDVSAHFPHREHFMSTHPREEAPE